jgi:hypothetical protein
MEIEAAILCDAATVREGLIHILGGPITRIWRPALPAPLGVALAVIICMTPQEQPVPHELQVTIRNDQHDIFNAMGGLQAGTPVINVEAGEMLMAPFAMPLHAAGSDAYGRHVVSISIDHGVAEKEIDFWLLHPEELSLPIL